MNVQIGPIELELPDDADPQYSAIIGEIISVYDFESIEYRQGDVILDIGAHVGLVSMYLAKAHPEVTVYAYEPIPENYERLLWCLKQNKVKNVRPHQLAVTSDGRDLEMIRGHHSAEATGFGVQSGRYVGESFIVKSTSIPRILRSNKIKRVRLLKLDCEGAEHEILANKGTWYDKVDYIRGEIHLTPELRELGYSVEGTTAQAEGKIGSWQIVSI